MERFCAYLGAIILLTIILFVIAAVLALPVMWIINGIFAPAFIASVFGAAKISFWKAFFLNLLCGFLFNTTTSTKSK